MTGETELLAKITEAVAEASKTETDLVSRKRELATAALELKQIYPAVKDFEAALGKVNGLKSLSWAYDCMKLAGGRTTEEQLRKDARERQAKSRAKKKTSKPIPKPRPKQTLLENGDVIEPEFELEFRDITENDEVEAEMAEASAERRKAEYAAADVDAAEPSGEKRRAKQAALDEFKACCWRLLPEMSTADLAEARSHFDLVAKQCAANNRRAA